MTFIWNIQVNLWGVVDDNNESFVEAFKGVRSRVKLFECDVEAVLSGRN